MSKVTSKLQVTIPKSIADAGQIRPGTEIEFLKAADGIRIVSPGNRAAPSRLSAKERLALFDAATRRQAARDRAGRKAARRGRKTKKKTPLRARRPVPPFAGAAGLVGACVLIRRHDARDPRKQAAATALLREGASSGALFIPYPALVEFVSALRANRKPGGRPAFSPAEALEAVEETMRLFPVLFPDAECLRTALRLAPACGLPWPDALVLAYADRFGLPTLYSDDFPDGRFFGAVRAQNPFRFASGNARAGGGA